MNESTMESSLNQGYSINLGLNGKVGTNERRERERKGRKEGRKEQKGECKKK